MIWEAAALLRILERKGRFDIGRMLLRSSVLSLGFLRMVVMTAILRDGGTMAELREEFAILVIIGERVGRL